MTPVGPLQQQTASLGFTKAILRLWPITTRGGIILWSEHLDVPEPSDIHEGNGATKLVPERAMVYLTPREQHVLEALQLGLPNKLIAFWFNLSENTAKMHIQRIMRKCSAHNRTEAVLRAFFTRISIHFARRRSNPRGTRCVLLRLVAKIGPGESRTAMSEWQSDIARRSLTARHRRIDFGSLQ